MLDPFVLTGFPRPAYTPAPLRLRPGGPSRREPFPAIGLGRSRHDRQGCCSLEFCLEIVAQATVRGAGRGTRLGPLFGRTLCLGPRSGTCPVTAGWSRHQDEGQGSQRPSSSRCAAVGGQSVVGPGVHRTGSAANGHRRRGERPTGNPRRTGSRVPQALRRGSPGKHRSTST